MAVVAGIAARDMRRVLATGDGSVVAGSACANHVQVVDGIGWRENIRVVAVFADLGCLDVADVLADSVRAVVTAAAVIENFIVTEVRG